MRTCSRFSRWKLNRNSGSGSGPILDFPQSNVWQLLASIWTQQMHHCIQNQRSAKQTKTCLSLELRLGACKSLEVRKAKIWRISINSWNFVEVDFRLTSFDLNSAYSFFPQSSFDLNWFFFLRSWLKKDSWGLEAWWLDLIRDWIAMRFIIQFTCLPVRRLWTLRHWD